MQIIQNIQISKCSYLTQGFAFQVVFQMMSLIREVKILTPSKRFVLTGSTYFSALEVR